MSADNSANSYDLTISESGPKTIEFNTDDARMSGLALQVTMSVTADDYSSVEAYTWTFTLLIEE